MGAFQLKRANNGLLAGLGLLLAACVSSGEKPSDTSFSISDVSVVAKSGADDRSHTPISIEHLDLIRTSVLETAANNSKPGAKKRLEVVVVSYNMASFGEAFVSREASRISASVVVRDIATGAPEGQYFAHAEVRPGEYSLWSRTAEEQGARASAIKAGKEIWQAAYDSGRRPLGTN